MGEVNPHAAEPPERDGAALEEANLVAVVVHGRDEDPEYMRAHLTGPLARPGLGFVLPRAEGRSWYPQSFLAPISDNEPRLGFALDALGGVVDELARRGGGAERVVLIGFSQGACLATEYVARRRVPLGGLVALTGGLIGPEGSALTRPGGVEGMPARFVTSAVDEFVPLGRVEETVELFRQAGADASLEVLERSPHEITDEARSVCRDLLDQVASKGRAPG